MSFIQALERLDKLFFIIIHNDSDHLLFDNFMILMRTAETWIPLYLFILIYSIKHSKNRSWIFILVSVMTFAVTDSVSAMVLKPLLARARPCFDPEIQPFIRNIVDCGGLYSFPSSHAANHFGLATFWYLSLQKITGKKWKWLWLWASLIGYAQIYVGKHFPSDILGGAVLGILVGSVMSMVFNNFNHVTLMHKKNSILPV